MKKANMILLNSLLNNISLYDEEGSINENKNWHLDEEYEENQFLKLLVAYRKFSELMNEKHEDYYATEKFLDIPKLMLKELNTLSLEITKIVNRYNTVLLEGEKMPTDRDFFNEISDVTDNLLSTYFLIQAFMPNDDFDVNMVPTPDMDNVKHKLSQTKQKQLLVSIMYELQTNASNMDVSDFLLDSMKKDYENVSLEYHFDDAENPRRIYGQLKYNETNDENLNFHRSTYVSLFQIQTTYSDNDVNAVMQSKINHFYNPLYELCHDFNKKWDESKTPTMSSVNWDSGNLGLKAKCSYETLFKDEDKKRIEKYKEILPSLYIKIRNQSCSYYKFKECSNGLSLRDNVKDLLDTLNKVLIQK